MTTSDERVAFISYASENTKKAEAVCASLEERGVACWMAPRDVRTGREYADEIIAAIERSTSVVLILSEAANTSVYVPREIERAVSKQKPIFSVRIEDVTPSPDLELFISGIQWIDAWTGSWSDHMNRLARDLSDSAAGTPRRGIFSGRRAPMEREASIRPYAAVGLVLVLAVSGLTIWRFSRETPRPKHIETPVRNETQAEPAQPPATATITPPPTSPPSASRETGLRRTADSPTRESARPVIPVGIAAAPSPAAVQNAGELNDLRELFDDLSIRGGVVDDTLNQLWEEMKPASPRIDMVTRQRSLRANLTRSKDALDGRNAAGARRYLEMARADLSALEEFLNR